MALLINHRAWGRDCAVQEIINIIFILRYTNRDTRKREKKQSEKFEEKCFMALEI